LRLKISTSTYLLRACSAALSFGLKNKTELKIKPKKPTSQTPTPASGGE